MRLILLLSLLAPSAFGDVFDGVVNSFGTTRTLIGIHHATTSNSDGAINFWDPIFEGQPAIDASLSNPHNAGADAYGNIYIADKASHSILKITPDGLLHTWAGTHIAGFNGDGPAPGNTLEIDSPNGLYVLPGGIVYVLDPGNHRIRRVAPNGAMTTVINDTDPNWAASGRALWVSQDEQLIYYTHEYPRIPNSATPPGAVLKKWTPAHGIEVICDLSVGFINPGNLDVNPADGKLYVTDRADDDLTRMAEGLFRIDGTNQRTRITGDATLPVAADGQFADESFIEQPRGLAFLADGSYFICGHRDGNVWYVDPAGMLHRYLAGLGKKDAYSLPDDAHPPLVDQPYFAQPRSVTLAPNGNLLVVSNDSGFLFQVQNIAPSFASNLTLNLDSTGALLHWNGVAGRGYRIERATDLISKNWSPLTAIGATTNRTEFRDAGAHTSPQRYYRVLPSL